MTGKERRRKVLHQECVQRWTPCLPSLTLSLSRTHTRTLSLAHTRTHTLALDERLVLAKKSVKRLVSFFGGGDVWFSQLLATASVLSLSGIGSLGRIGSLGSGRHRQPLATTPGLKKGINVQTLQLWENSRTHTLARAFPAPTRTHTHTLSHSLWHSHTLHICKSYVDDEGGRRGWGSFPSQVVESVRIWWNGCPSHFFFAVVAVVVVSFTFFALSTKWLWPAATKSFNFETMAFVLSS